jgi:hypothetical protein
MYLNTANIWLGYGMVTEPGLSIHLLYKYLTRVNLQVREPYTEWERRPAWFIIAQKKGRSVIERPFS